MIVDTLEQAEQVLLQELERNPKRIFDLGNGELGTLKAIHYYKNVDGIDQLEFEPIQNDYYWKVKEQLRDHFTCWITDWTPLLSQIK
jgi:spermidine synthase